MTFDEYWKRLILANPRLNEDANVMKISVKSKIAMRQAFEAGRFKETPELPDFFKTFFKGK